jgi:hypothetical protein
LEEEIIALVAILNDCGIVLLMVCWNANPF